MSENQDIPEAIPEALRKQLSDAGKKGIKKVSIAQRAKGGRAAQRKTPHEERVRRGKLAWQRRLEKARALAESLEPKGATAP